MLYYNNNEGYKLLYQLHVGCYTNYRVNTLSV
ncbi:hypothetical protein [Klebsiella phage 05F01]|nr:hypothetical protein [Klebsiella phage 05F01]